MASKLYVGGLPWGVSSDELQSLFQDYGLVVNAFVVQDRETGRSRGFGFVEFDSSDDATRAREAMNGQDVQGRTITVNDAHERRPRD